MKKNRSFVFFLCAIRLVIPYLLQSPVYEPHRDELLYLAQGHHMAFGYLEIPPVLSIFAWLTRILGNGMFWIKLWPSLMGVVTMFFTFRIIERLGGGRFAMFLTFLAFLFGAYLRVFFLFQPNAPEILFWILISYSVLRYIQTEKNSYLYYMGICIGLGLLSKYSVGLFVVSLFLGLALTRERKVFGNRHFYFACILGGLIFLPTAIWEYLHHFPIMVHMRQLDQRQLQYVSHSSFLKDQLIMNLPAAFVWIAGLYYTGFSFKGRKYRPFAWAYFWVIALLLILHGKNYYSLGIYPLLFGFGSYHLESFSQNRTRAWRLGMVTFTLVLGLLFLPIMLPIAKPARLDRIYQQIGAAKTGTLRWEDLRNHPLPQDFADMLGWREMAQKATKAYDQLDSTQKAHTFIFCDNYGEAGAIQYYGHRLGLPEGHSDNGSFLLWLPKKQYITNLLLITDDQKEMTHPFIKDFKSVAYLDSITNPYARERGSLVILLMGADSAFNKMMQQKFRKDKDVYK